MARNPFKPSIAAPLAHCMQPDLKAAQEEAGRAAQRLAQHRHDEEQARLLAVAAAKTRRGR